MRRRGYKRVDEKVWEWYNSTIQYQSHADGVHSLQCSKVPFAEMQMALFLFFGHFIIGIEGLLQNKILKNQAKEKVTENRQSGGSQ